MSNKVEVDGEGCLAVIIIGLSLGSLFGAAYGWLGVGCALLLIAIVDRFK